MSSNLLIKTSSSRIRSILETVNDWESLANMYHKNESEFSDYKDLADSLAQYLDLGLPYLRVHSISIEGLSNLTTFLKTAYDSAHQIEHNKAKHEHIATFTEHLQYLDRKRGVAKVLSHFLQAFKPYLDHAREFSDACKVFSKADVQLVKARRAAIHDSRHDHKVQLLLFHHPIHGQVCGCPDTDYGQVTISTLGTKEHPQLLQYLGYDHASENEKGPTIYYKRCKPVPIINHHGYIGVLTKFLLYRKHTLGLVEKIHLAKQACLGLFELHDAQYVHHKVRTDCFFIDWASDKAPDLKLGDFAHARPILYPGGMEHDHCSSFAPPPRFAEEKADLHSPGKVLVCIFCPSSNLEDHLELTAPFYGREQSERLLQQILSDNPPIAESVRCNKQDETHYWYEGVKELLNPDPMQCSDTIIRTKILNKQPFKVKFNL